MEYQLELKQIVDYPRCRIYRNFVRRLMQDTCLRTKGSSYLFYYIILCSYANFRTSYQRLDGTSYIIAPGEWICSTAELSQWFRSRYQHQALSILDYLQNQNYITYTRLDRGKLIKFKINNWKANNTSLEYNYPCQKDVGFFFFPVAVVHELISMGKCSEMDIVLDLWIHAIYNDSQVRGSDIGPVVYFRNLTGCPVINYRDLAERWGLSKTTVSRLIKKLEEQKYLTTVSFTGTHGSVLYLQSYLSTMFNISDVMIDKEEVSLTFRIPVTIKEDSPMFKETEANTHKQVIRDDQIIVPKSVPESQNSVPKSHIYKMVQKAAEVLAAQGIPCCECGQSLYKLYRLSGCGESTFRYCLKISCIEREAVLYQFEFNICPLENALPDNINQEPKQVFEKLCLNHGGKNYE